MATKKQTLTRNNLEHKHDLYLEYSDDWALYDVIYRGGSDLIKYALKQNPRESDDNFLARLRDGYAFNDGRTIIDLFNFFLNQKEPTRDLGPLVKFEPWSMFYRDADLQGTDYNNLINEAAKFASAFGSIGILVNKPSSVGQTLADDIEAGIYPYYSLYLLPNIYDWEFVRDPKSHRMVLSYLKLKEPDDTYTIWTPGSWERWGIEKKSQRPRMIASGQNALGEIPFVWMQNIRNLMFPVIGISDINDIAHIVVSIIQNLSSGEEIIKFAGFPIMRRPMEREGEFRDGTDEVPVSVTAVEEYDPSLGEAAKPDWMPTEVLEPVEAILKWIDRKTEEIEELAHINGIRGQRRSDQGGVHSGLSLRYAFSQLNSMLQAKTKNINEAEYQCLRLWLKWAGQEKIIKDVHISRTTEFSIDDLAVALDNAVTAMDSVKSKRFREIVQDKIVKTVTPDCSPQDLAQIRSEISIHTPDGDEEMSLPKPVGGDQPKFKTGANAVKDTSAK
jgi:hypothetical protein